MSINKYHQTKLALGSDTTLVIVADLPIEKVNKMFAKLWLIIFEFEKRYSRFLHNSELTLFNKNAGNATKVSDEFIDLIKKSIYYAIKTDHLYNPFILPALQRSGYTRSFVSKYADDIQDSYISKSVYSVNSIKINKNIVTIPANSAIEFGGIGKGYLADKLASTSELKNVIGYWFSIGGDITARGKDTNGLPWSVGVQDANNPSELLDWHYKSNLDTFCIATSGVIIRNFKDATGNLNHHIIDPRTLKPAKSDVRLATIVAYSTTDADVIASCAVIAGSQDSVAIFKKFKIKDYALQLNNGDILIAGGFSKPKKARVVL